MIFNTFSWASMPCLSLFWWNASWWLFSIFLLGYLFTTIEFCELFIHSSSRLYVCVYLLVNSYFPLRLHWDIIDKEQCKFKYSVIIWYTYTLQHDYNSKNRTMIWYRNPTSRFKHKGKKIRVLKRYLLPLVYGRMIQNSQEMGTT